MTSVNAFHLDVIPANIYLYIYIYIYIYIYTLANIELRSQLDDPAIVSHWF